MTKHARTAPPSALRAAARANGRGHTKTSSAGSHGRTFDSLLVIHLNSLQITYAPRYKSSAPTFILLLLKCHHFWRFRRLSLSVSKPRLRGKNSRRAAAEKNLQYNNLLLFRMYDTIWARNGCRRRGAASVLRAHDCVRSRGAAVPFHFRHFIRSAETSAPISVYMTHTKKWRAASRASANPGVNGRAGRGERRHRNFWHPLVTKRTFHVSPAQLLRPCDFAALFSPFRLFITTRNQHRGARSSALCRHCGDVI